MRRPDYTLIPILLAAFWVAGALTAAGVYVGDAAPAGAEVPVILGELMFVLAGFALGAVVGVRLAWVARIALWFVLLIVASMTVTISLVSNALTSPSCPSCDTAGFFIAPATFILSSVALALLIPAGYGLRVGAARLWRRRRNLNRNVQA